MQLLSVSRILFLLVTSHIALGSAQENAVKRRQVDETEEPSPRQTSTKTQPSSESNEKESPTPTRPANSESSTSNKSSQTGTRSGTRTGTFVDPRLPPGGVVIQTPITTSGSLYYKIGQPITFGWNYTSLVVSPTAVNVEAFCFDNSQTYTIAQNVSLSKPTVVWDTAEYTPEKDQPPLAMGIYTLQIYDERTEMTDIPSAGKLAPFNGFKFGMYTGRPYTPLSDFNCATCETSEAAALDVIALRMFLILGIITSVSFSWFITILI